MEQKNKMAKVQEKIQAHIDEVQEQSQPVQVVEVQDVEEEQSQPVQIVEVQDVEEEQSQPVQINKVQDVEEEQSQPVQNVEVQDVEEEQSQPVQVVEVQDMKEEQSQPVQMDEIKVEDVQSFRNTEEHIKALVEKLYSNSRNIIQEFLEDGLVSGFKDIPMVVWFNVLSSLCALAMRMIDILGNEKLQEAVVYQTMLMILSNDVPLEQDQRSMAISVYKRVAPTVIDILIPGKDDCLYKVCCCLPKLGRKRKTKGSKK
jgi:hypothetical protein